jgi:hypothetical protein
MFQQMLQQGRRRSSSLRDINGDLVDQHPLIPVGVHPTMQFAAAPQPSGGVPYGRRCGSRLLCRCFDLRPMPAVPSNDGHAISHFSFSLSHYSHANRYAEHKSNHRSHGIG